MSAPRPRANGRSRSGLQVSYRRAVEAIVELLDDYEPSRVFTLEERVEEALAGALSEKQRARLEARDGS